MMKRRSRRTTYMLSPLPLLSYWRSPRRSAFPGRKQGIESKEWIGGANRNHLEYTARQVAGEETEDQGRLATETTQFWGQNQDLNLLNPILYFPTPFLCVIIEG